MDLKTHSEEGGCTCGQVRYRLTVAPMIVHCCHCRGCQRNSGSAFAINALFESERVELTAGEVETITVPTPSGTGQDISRCVECKVAVWSNYHMGGLRERIRFVRVGTLDNPDLLPPDVHIFAASMQPWVVLPTGAQRVDVFYDYEETWSPENLQRLGSIRESAGV